MDPLQSGRLERGHRRAVAHSKIDSRELINFDISYRVNKGNWSIAAYGRNVTDERYDNARLNVADYVLIMLSNDAIEFGVRFTKEF